MILSFFLEYKCEFITKSVLYFILMVNEMA